MYDNLTVRTLGKTAVHKLAEKNNTQSGTGIMSVLQNRNPNLVGAVKAFGTVKPKGLAWTVDKYMLDPLSVHMEEELFKDPLLSRTPQALRPLVKWTMDQIVRRHPDVLPKGTVGHEVYNQALKVTGDADRKAISKFVTDNPQKWYQWWTPPTVTSRTINKYVPNIVTRDVKNAPSFTRIGGTVAGTLLAGLILKRLLTKKTKGSAKHQESDSKKPLD